MFTCMYSLVPSVHVHVFMYLRVQELWALCIYIAMLVNTNALWSLQRGCMKAAASHGFQLCADAMEFVYSCHLQLYSLTVIKCLVNQYWHVLKSSCWHSAEI